MRLKRADVIAKLKGGDEIAFSLLVEDRPTWMRHSGDTVNFRTFEYLSDNDWIVHSGAFGLIDYYAWNEKKTGSNQSSRAVAG